MSQSSFPADRDFDKVIPIGGWCRPTYQIRRYFGFKAAYPFDWLICPTPGLLKMLDDDFKGLLQPERLEIRSDFDGITCQHYGIQHKHDFLRTSDHRARNDFLDQIDSARSKYDYRLANLRRDASTGSVLFVRYDDPQVFNNHEEASGVHYSRADRKDADNILAALRRLYPAADVTLLALNFDMSWDGDPALLVGGDAADYGDRSTSDYGGSDAGWDELLGGLNLSKLPDHARPGLDSADISDVGLGYW